MKLLNFISSVLWGLGCLGNGVLFLRMEWIYLRQDFFQIFNPSLHVQVLEILLSTSLFWIFLAMSVLRYCATLTINKQVRKNGKKYYIKAEKFASKLLQKKQQTQSRIPFSYSIQQQTNKQLNAAETEYIKQQVKLIELAIQSSQNVQFIYKKRDGERSTRTVTPIAFKTVNQTLCLQGYCYLRQAERTFAIKHIRNISFVSLEQISCICGIDA